ncbi:MAG: DM13 domain-containing protein [Pseudomonadota bacterium]
MSKALLLLTHLGCIAAGFALGIYALPILMAPESPVVADAATLERSAVYSGEFRRDLVDSDFLHWGDGQVYLSADAVTFSGELAPGPDYRLYLSPSFVETEAAFESLKPQMVELGPVKTFKDFIVTIDEPVNLSDYNTVVVWCESFGQFITAAQYR